LQDFNVISIPRIHNAVVDALENNFARMSPLRDEFSIEILYKPSILDNITKLCIFYDNQHILYLMENTDMFKDAMTNEDE